MTMAMVLTRFQLQHQLFNLACGDGVQGGARLVQQEAGLPTLAHEIALPKSERGRMPAIIGLWEPFDAIRGRNALSASNKV